MPELTANQPRLDVEVYAESCALFVSNAKVRKVFEKADDENTATGQAIESRQLIAVELDKG